MFGNIGSSELVIILVVFALGAILGKDKVSEMAKTIGESTKELKKAKKEIESPEISEDPVEETSAKEDND